MTTFVNPRSNPAPRPEPRARTTTDLDSLTELHQLCREGRLYEVERWIQDGRPLQLSADTELGRRRPTSALEIALKKENQALVFLLLCNGYDPNFERSSPLSLPLRARRGDLVDLLLDWGAHPNEVDLTDLFDTYNSKLFERFRALGVDLTVGHELAEALGYHTSNKATLRIREAAPEARSQVPEGAGYRACVPCGRGKREGGRSLSLGRR